MTDGGVSWTLFLGTLLGVLGFVTTGWAVFTKILHSTMSKRIDDALEKLDDSAKQTDADMVKLEERLKEYFLANDRLRDKWDNFLTEYLKIDSTRGQKLDAVFRVLDNMQDTVRELPKNMNDKIEESFTHSLSELKLYVRELMAKELPHGN